MAINSENIVEREKFPVWIDISPEMNEPNEVITVHKGEIILKNGPDQIALNGTLKFQWFPNKGIRFDGRPQENSFEILSFYQTDKDLEIIVDGFNVGRGYITRISDTVKGIIKFPSLKDRTVSVEKIRFSVPNLRHIRGLAVRNKESTGFSWSRLIFDTEEYLIHLDSRIDYSEKREKLREQGGFLLLYGGELVPKSKKGSITLDEAKEVFRCFNMFLSFIQGARVSAYFQKGIYHDEVIWENYPSGFVQPYKDGVSSWIPDEIANELSRFWTSFYKLWFKKGEDDFLNTAIHWYLEANNYSGFVEGSLVMAQNALELIYNWWIVEEKKMIGGKDADNISASNKIRLILSQMNVETGVPKDLAELGALRIEEENRDGPGRIVQLRNAIVHSQKKKRVEYNAITPDAKHQGLRLSLYYIELALLKILAYNGTFVNRTKKTMLERKSELVPWVSKET